MATREAKYLYEVQLKGRELKGVFRKYPIWGALPRLIPLRKTTPNNKKGTAPRIPRP